MKKIGVFLGVLFMGLLIFVRSPDPARADAWVLPFSKVPDILEMAQTLFSGGKLEFSSIISDFSGLDDIIDMWQDFKDNLAHSQTVQRANTTLNSLVELTRSGVSAISSSTDLVIPFTFGDAAAFMQYNPYWYIYNINAPDVSIPNPDSDYLSYLDNLNYHGNTANSFWFYNNDVTIGNVSFLRNLYNTPITCYSYVVSNLSSNLNSLTTPDLFVYNIFDIHIYSYNDTYAFSETITPINIAGFSTRNGSQYTEYSSVNFHDTTFGLSNISVPSSVTLSFNGSLTECFNYLTRRVRNVNIYVDDVLWSSVDLSVDLPVLAPDVINVGDTGLDTYDVYGLEQPDDLGLDIPNFIDWILNKLMEGATTISLDDAIAEEVPLVKTIDGVRAINYEDTRPVEQVIEISLDPDPNPTPTPNPDDPTPPILKLPTFNMMPAPHETTVLSELIDATQKTVPEELMNLIWNCFGLLVIGGLIFILHK